MPRKRLRPDFIQRHYTFHATLAGPIPQGLWDTARGMQALWNALVDKHEGVRASYDATTPRSEVQEKYAAFWQEAYLHIREEGRRLGLSAWPKWQVYDTFQAALRRYSRKQAGPPHIHHGLRRILLPYRTDSGGVAQDWLWEDNDRKHTAILPPEPGHHHQRAYFTIGKERVPLYVLLHRPIPKAAIIKRIALRGTFEPMLRRPGESGWHWQFQITMELPPIIPKPKVHRTCGIDLGWRVRDDGLRLAVVTDGTASWEWLLPYDLSNSAVRHYRRFFAKHGHGDVPESTGNWRQLWAMQRSMDLELEQCKAALKDMQLDGWPLEALNIVSRLRLVRASGLRRLRRHLHEADMPCQVLDDWWERHMVRARRLRASQLQVQRSQDYLYRILADWLARHFDVISWEGDLGLKELAEATPDREDPGHYALNESQKYRQQASLARLRRYIQEAVVRDGRTLLDQKAEYTTQTCADCGAPVPVTSFLMGTCLEGHVMDQDITAARNLWQMVPVEERSIGASTPTVDRDLLLKSVHRLI